MNTRKRRRWRIRPGSPLWWAEGIAVTLLLIVGIYAAMGAAYVSMP